MSGVLDGLRVLEIAGIGPAPHAAMMMADWGASVIRIERPGGDLAGIYPEAKSHVRRGRPVLELDLKHSDDVARLLELASKADVLLEGMRPGVAERLGIGPEVVAQLNPELVYARMTGWGQDGPLANAVGHDINYISVTGVLAAIGTGESPVVPLNLVGDYGGGSTFLVMSILGALYERQSSGLGQTLDVAMLDGVGVLVQQMLGMRSAGEWSARRADNLLDGGAPFYTTYECADGRYVAVGALEPQFYEVLVRELGLTYAGLPDRHDRARWPELAEAFASVFGTKTRDEWATQFWTSNACVTPVLTFDEAVNNEQVAARRAIVATPDGPMSGRGPRFSRSSARDDAGLSLGDALALWQVTRHENGSCA